MTMAKRRTKWLLEHLFAAILVFSMTTIWWFPSCRLPLGDESSISMSAPQQQPSPALNKPTTFLMGIFSMLEETESRQLMRSTMLGPDLPESTKSRLCSLQEYLAAPNKQCQLIYTFVIGGNPDAGMAYPENPTELLVENYPNNNATNTDESDLVFLNIRENMNHGKTPSWFHYASTLLDRYGIDYVSKLDLDTLISLPQLLDFVNTELPPRLPLPRVFGGLMMDFENCGGKWFQSRCDPANSKAYMSGQFYFCSHDIVQYQSKWRTNSTFKSRKHEDLNFGIRVWGYAHALKIMALNPNYFWYHPLKNETQWMEGFHKLKANGWKISERYFVNDVFKPPKGSNAALLEIEKRAMIERQHGD